MAGGLQHPQTTFGVGQSDTDGICRENTHGQTGRVRPSNKPQGLSVRWRKLGAQVTAYAEMFCGLRDGFSDADEILEGRDCLGLKWRSPRGATLFTGVDQAVFGVFRY